MKTLPSPENGDFDCPKAHACRMCECGFCRALRNPAARRVTEEMVERACTLLAKRDDGAVWPTDYSDAEVEWERRHMRELLEHALGESFATSTNGADGGA